VLTFLEFRAVSFESLMRPGHYVSHRDGMIYVEQGDVNNEAFKKECSWLVRKDIFFNG
jgi:hypothetical protein